MHHYLAAKKLCITIKCYHCSMSKCITTCFLTILRKLSKLLTDAIILQFSELMLKFLEVLLIYYRNVYIFWFIYKKIFFSNEVRKLIDCIFTMMSPFYRITVFLYTNENGDDGKMNWFPKNCSFKEIFL